MDSSNFILRSLDLSTDAARLAKMWNDSDDQWPGSFTSGVPMTAEIVVDWLKNEDMLDIMVWDTGEEIAGYCSWSKNLKEADVYYIPLLNVAPKYQKHSLARKFLVHFVDRTVKVGGKRLDLHTWSGNLKAVPLYKKCGFRWMPKTEVFMLNFMPWLLNLPLFEEFFQRNYWYNVQVCELNQEEDNQHLGNANVFSYKFVSEHESIEAWFDRESRALIGIDTPTFKVTSIPESLHPIKGMKTYVHLALENKTDSAMPITVITDSNEAFVTSYKRSIDGLDNQTTEDIIDVDVNAVFPSITSKDPAKSVKTNIVVQNQLIEFANGLRPTEALKVTTHPPYINAQVGFETEFFVYVQNQTLAEIEYIITFAESDLYEIDIDITSCKVEEGVYGVHKISVKPLTEESFDIPYCINLLIGTKELMISNKSIAVLVKPIGGVGLVKETNGSFRVENDFTRVIFNPDYSLSIFELRSNKFVSFSSVLAPPIWPSVFRISTWELSGSITNGIVTVQAKTFDTNTPSWAITRTLKLSSSNVIELYHTVLNLSENDCKKYIASKIYFDSFNGNMCLPMPNGIVVDDCIDFPGMSDEVSNKLGFLQENWMMLKNQYLSIGFVLAPDSFENEIEWSCLNLKNREYEVASGETKFFPSMYLVIQPRDFQAVRDVYLKTNPTHDRIYPKNPEVINSYLTALFDPKIITCNEETDKLWLNIHNFTARKLSGSLVLEPEDQDVYLSSKHFAFNDLDYKRPFASDITVKVIANETKPIRVNCTLDTPEKTVYTNFNVIKLAKPGKVIIDQSNTNGISVHTISNGVLDIELSPDFAGSVTSIKFRGAEQLFSSFPNRSALGWLSPWFGGIMPIIYPCSLTPEDDDNYVYPGRLYREKITAESSAQMDKQYNKWQGVTLSSFIQDEDFKGIEFAFSVYTLPFSNVIKLKVSLANSTAAHKKAYCGYSCFAAPSGNRKTSILQYEGTEQRPTIIGKWRQAGYWALALDPETNFSVGLTSCHQSFFQSGWGEEGNYIDFISTANLLPKQEIEYVSYMCFISKHSQFEQYNELKHLL